MLSKRDPFRVYIFAWNNREIAKGTELLLTTVGKLNSAQVKRLSDGKSFITDRRALRKCHCGSCEERKEVRA